MSAPIVIVGGGHAAAQLCLALAKAGAGRGVCVVCDEGTPPYHRPPLSKNYLLNAAEAPQLLQLEAWYASQGIDVRMGDPAAEIDRAAHVVRLASGAELHYGKLVLATGSRARGIPVLDGPLANVFKLRSLADASRLRDLLQRDADDKELTVLGGGFIGLEVAASARRLGRAVRVIEAAPRLLSRAVSPELSSLVAAHHARSGVVLMLDAQACDPVIREGRVAGLQVGGTFHSVDQLLLGVGAIPNTELAEACGLSVDNGIRVDGSMRTSDPDILAIGDCTAFEYGGRRIRLESVQNANEQAKVAALALLGQMPGPYRPVPAFWSDQGGMRLQIAGLWQPGLRPAVRPGSVAGSLSIFHFDGDTLVAVESINAPGDHLAARRLLEQGLTPTPAQASDPGFVLKTLG